MPDIALRPRSSTEIVDAAFQLYRRDALPFIAAVALVYVPWLLVIAATGLAGTAVGGDPTAGGVAPLLWFLAGAMIAYVLAASVTTCLARDVYFGDTVDVGKAFRTVARRLADVVLASLIVGGCIVFGSMLFILPGIYLYGRLFAAKQAVLLEEHGGIAAVGRSWRLAKGSVGHVISTMGLALLLNLALGLGASFVGRLIPSQIVQMLISTIVACLVYPMVGIIETLLYYDLRIRREGFDIEYLAAAPPSTLEQSAAT